MRVTASTVRGASHLRCDNKVKTRMTSRWHAKSPNPAFLGFENRCTTACSQGYEMDFRLWLEPVVANHAVP